MAQPAEGDGGLDPHAIAQRSFPLASRGYDPRDVGAFLVRVAAEVRTLRSLVAELREREADLCAELDRSEARAEAAEARAAAWFDELDPEAVADRLGDEAARALAAARADADTWRAEAADEATALRAEARREAERLLADARRQAEDLVAEQLLEAAETVREARQRAQELASAQAEEAAAGAAAVLEAARAEAEALVTQAREEDEARVEELSRRHQALRRQVEQLHAGRERLLEAFGLVKETVDLATAELDVALPEARLAARAAAERADRARAGHPEPADRRGAAPTGAAGGRAPTAAEVLARLRAEEREARLAGVVRAVAAAVRAALAEDAAEAAGRAAAGGDAGPLPTPPRDEQHRRVAAAVRRALDEGPDLGLPAGGEAADAVAGDVADAVVDGLRARLERATPPWGEQVAACYREAAGPALDAVVGHAVRAGAARAGRSPR